MKIPQEFMEAIKGLPSDVSLKGCPISDEALIQIDRNLTEVGYDLLCYDGLAVGMIHPTSRYKGFAPEVIIMDYPMLGTLDEDTLDDIREYRGFDYDTELNYSDVMIMLGEVRKDPADGVVLDFSGAIHGASTKKETGNMEIKAYGLNNHPDIMAFYNDYEVTNNDDFWKEIERQQVYYPKYDVSYITWDHERNGKHVYELHVLCEHDDESTIKRAIECCMALNKTNTKEPCEANPVAQAGNKRYVVFAMYEGLNMVGMHTGDSREKAVAFARDVLIPKLTNEPKLAKYLMDSVFNKESINSQADLAMGNTIGYYTGDKSDTRKVDAYITGEYCDLYYMELPDNGGIVL